MEAGPTSRTRLVGAIGAVALLVLGVLSRPGLADPGATDFARSLGLVGFPLYGAAMAGWTSANSETSVWLRGRWALTCAALASFGFGEAIEEFYYVMVRHMAPPEISFGRLLIVLAPMLLGAAFAVAMLGLRRLTDVTWPMIAGVLAALIVTMISWGALWTSPSALGMRTLDAALVMGYPLLLAWFVTAPLVACIVAVMHLRDRVLTRPWWLTGAGVLAMLLSSLLLLAQAQMQSPWNAGPGELMLWLGCVFIALGASREVDVQRVRVR